MSKCRGMTHKSACSKILKSVCSNTQWSTVCQTRHWSLRNSGKRHRLQNVWPKRQFECRLPEEYGSTSSAARSLTESGERTSELAHESQKVQIRRRQVAQSTRTCKRPLKFHRCSRRQRTAEVDVNSQNVPKTVEVSKQQYTDMSVDVPAEMQRQVTITHRRCRQRRKHNRFQSHERAEGDPVEQQRQWSTIRGVQESLLRQGERRERSEQNTVKSAQV